MVIVPEKEVDFPDEHRRSSSNSEKKSNVDLESFRARDGELTIKHQHFHVLNDWTMDPPSVPVPVGDQVLGRPAAVSGELSLSPAAVSLGASHRFVS